MEEKPKKAEGIKLDFRRPRSEPEEGQGRHRTLVWAGLVVALLMMFTGTAVTTMAPRQWRPAGLYLFLASALLYLFCRCLSIGVLNTLPKVFTVLLMLGGCFILSQWPAGSAMGAVGIACLSAAFILVLLFGLGYLRQERSKGPGAS